MRGPANTYRRVRVFLGWPSFGERWAQRVMPQVLKELMRHGEIDTTLRYYVGRNAATTAATIWEWYDGHGAALGDFLGDSTISGKPNKKAPP